MSNNEAQCTSSWTCVQSSTNAWPPPPCPPAPGPTADVVGVAADADAAWRTERRTYRDLYLTGNAIEALWRIKVDRRWTFHAKPTVAVNWRSNRPDTRVTSSWCMWSTPLLRRRNRRCTFRYSWRPSGNVAPTGCSMLAFRSVSIADVTTAIQMCQWSTTHASSHRHCRSAGSIHHNTV